MTNVQYLKRLHHTFRQATPSMRSRLCDQQLRRGVCTVLQAEAAEAAISSVDAPLSQRHLRPARCNEFMGKRRGGTALQIRYPSLM